MLMLGNFGAKRNLYFTYFALLLFKKLSRATGQVGARALERRPWDTSTHFTQLFKNVLLRINLDQNMPKNVYICKVVYLPQKSSIFASGEYTTFLWRIYCFFPTWGRSLFCKALLPDSHVVPPAY